MAYWGQLLQKLDLKTMSDEDCRKQLDLKLEVDEWFKYQRQSWDLSSLITDKSLCNM